MSSSLLNDLLKKKQTITDKKTGSKNTYKFKQRQTIIRILPSWREASAEDRPFYHDFGMAYIKDLDGNLLAVVGDRKMTYGEDDPIRNLLNAAMGEAATDAQREHYKQMLAKQRHVVNACVLNDKDVDPSNPEIVEFSQNQLEQIIDKMIFIAKDGEDPLNFANGYNLVINKEGTGLMTRYSFDFERRPSSISEDVMERVTDLDAFVRSKFVDSDRAINAIKSISQAASLPAPERSLSYTGGSTATNVVEAEYSAVEEAKDVRDPIKTENISASEQSIEDLLRDF